MEFVVVTFSNTRGVNINGAPRGQTGQLLRLQAGTHNFDLGRPLDYTPSSVMTPVRGTTFAAPMIIAFLPLTAAERRAARSMTATPPAAGRKKRARRSTRKETAGGVGTRQRAMIAATARKRRAGRRRKHR